LAQQIVAVAPVTEPELQALGSSFDRAWPINETPCFSGLREAIDEADRDYWRARDASDRERRKSSNEAPLTPAPSALAQ
jgi:hypothetical protein